MFVSRVSTIPRQFAIHQNRKTTRIVTYPKRMNRKPLQVRSDFASSMVSLNNFVNDSNLTLVSHAIVDFSVIYFTLNWFSYRSIRKAKKDKKNK